MGLLLIVIFLKSAASSSSLSTRLAVAIVAMIGLQMGIRDKEDPSNLLELLSNELFLMPC
jgi:hypothetical protein